MGSVGMFLVECFTFERGSIFIFRNQDRYSFCHIIFFHILFNIRLNCHHTKTYYIPNWRKFNEDSAELDHFDVATLERELQPRKPVHFYFTHPLFRNLDPCDGGWSQNPMWTVLAKKAPHPISPALRAIPIPPVPIRLLKKDLNGIYDWMAIGTGLAILLSFLYLDPVGSLGSGWSF